MRALLSNPDFRRLFLGRLVTNAGDSLYAVAAMWLVFSLTGSTLYTGLAGFLTLGPQALQAFVGPLVDRVPLRRVLVATQATQAVLVLTVPVAALLGVLSAPLVLAVMPLLALLNQFVYPAQTAALPRLVERERLTAANAAFTMAYQGSELVFNALAGLLVAAVGAVSLYVVDSLTFAVAVALFAGVRVPPAGEGESTAADGTGSAVASTDVDGREAEPADVDGPMEGSVDDGLAALPADANGPREVATDDGPEERPADGARPGEGPVAADGDAGYLASLREGFAFVRGTVVLPMLGTGFIANALLGATLAVLPAFAAARGGAGTYGLLMAAVATGSLLGALVASRFQRVPFGRLAMAGFLVGATAWFGALVAPWVPATVALFAAAFVPVGVTNIVSMTLLQRLVPDALLGRVTALAGSASTAIMPVGTLAGGAAGDVLGADAVMVAGGVGFLWIVGYVAAIPRLRRLPAAVDAETIDPAAVGGGTGGRGAGARTAGGQTGSGDRSAATDRPADVE